MTNPEDTNKKFTEALASNPELFSDVDYNRAKGWAAVESMVLNEQAPSITMPLSPPDGRLFRNPLDELRIGRVNPFTGKNSEIELISSHEAEKLKELEEKRPLQGENPEDDLEFKQAITKLVSETLNETPKVIYNPGSGEHVSIAVAFPEARTIFVDDDPNIEHRFVQRHNDLGSGNEYEFYRADSHEFSLPDSLKADVVLLLNAGYMTQEELDAVTNVGSVVAINNWHQGVDYMINECPHFQSVGSFEVNNLPDNTLHAFKRIA